MVQNYKEFGSDVKANLFRTIILNAGKLKKLQI